MGDTLRFSSRLQRWGLYCLTSSVNKAVIYLWLLNQKKKIPKSVLLRHTKQPSTRIFIWNQRRSSLSAPVTSLTSVDSFGKNPLKSGAVSERFCPLRSPFSRLGTSELLPSLWIYLHCRISSRWKCFIFLLHVSRGGHFLSGSIQDSSFVHDGYTAWAKNGQRRTSRNGDALWFDDTEKWILGMRSCLLLGSQGHLGVFMNK